MAIRSQPRRHHPYLLPRSADRRWRALTWEHAPNLTLPLSKDALTFARRLAAAKYAFPDDRLAIADLLQRWNAGLGDSLAERRIALRISRSQAALDLPLAEQPMTPAARKALPRNEPAPDDSDHAGDDDIDELAVFGLDDDFYADALEDA